MSDSQLRSSSSLLALTATIISAHAEANEVETSALPSLIQNVYMALADVDTPPALAETLKPAVPVKRSVFPDYIVCLEDGQKMKMLKRYIKKRFDLTPSQYREKWGLPGDYPMVAPAYSARRSTLARQFGLGRVKDTEVVEAVEVKRLPAGKRGVRRSKAERAAVA